jgi:hypothetical protein
MEGTLSFFIACRAKKKGKWRDLANIDITIEKFGALEWNSNL